MTIQQKAIGDNTPQVIIAKEKQELRPGTNPTPVMKGGFTKILSPLDMIEPSNLGYTARKLNNDVFRNKMRVEGPSVNSLIPPKKQVDEMGLKELKEYVHGKALKKPPKMSASKIEKMLNRDGADSFCKKCQYVCNNNEKNFKEWLKQ